MTQTRTDDPHADRNVVRDARTRRSQRGFYLALAAILIVGLAVIGYAWRSGRDDGATTTVSRDSSAALATGGYVQGSPAAPIEIIEFGDFECPGCGQFATTTEPQIRANLVETGVARFRFIDLQVKESHRNSPAASVAAACANEQGKFWPMHDLIFAGQGEWSTGATLQPKAILQTYAQKVGLDMRAWDSCFDAQRYLAQLPVNAQAAKRLGLRFTPSILIGNRVLIGAQPYDPVKATVDSVLAESKAAPTGDRGKPTGG
jgi:protein-disulfide isomerase